MNTRHTAQRQQGAAMIEVLVSILIFSVGILGLIGLQARAVQLSVDTEDRNRAALLANELVAEMWLRRTPTLPEAIETAWKGKVKSGLREGDGSYTTNGKQVDVTIQWEASGAAQSSRLTTRVVLP